MTAVDVLWSPRIFARRLLWVSALWLPSSAAGMASSAWPVLIESCILFDGAEGMIAGVDGWMSRVAMRQWASWIWLMSA